MHTSSSSPAFPDDDGIIIRDVMIERKSLTGEDATATTIPPVASSSATTSAAAGRETTTTTTSSRTNVSSSHNKSSPSSSSSQAQHQQSGKGSSSRLEIIPELTSLLLDFTVSVLVNKPPDLIEYACQHFSHLLEDRQNYESGSQAGDANGRTTKTTTTATTTTTTSHKHVPRSLSGESSHQDEEEDDFSESFTSFTPTHTLLTMLA